MSGPGALLTIEGNTTADPELRFTQSGLAVASFNVAHTPRRFNRQSNEWENAGETLFLRVNVWRDQGRNVAETVRKGDAVLILGYLVPRSYTDREGIERSTVELDAQIVSIDLRRQRAERVTRVRNDAAAQAADESWAPSGVTPISSASSAA